jgi:hypothetical protein
VSQFIELQNPVVWVQPRFQPDRSHPCTAVRAANEASLPTQFRPLHFPDFSPQTLLSERGRRTAGWEFEDLWYIGWRKKSAWVDSRWKAICPNCQKKWPKKLPLALPVAAIQTAIYWQKFLSQARAITEECPRGGRLPTASIMLTPLPLRWKGVNISGVCRRGILNMGVFA